jgi:twitching motility two-component system response regulator PilG
MSTSAPAKPIVLTVDDSPIIHEMVRRALGENYKVLTADNAVDALATIYHQSISLVLLDVLMPGVDGLEFCRTLRNLPQFQSLPVIMVTSKDGAFDRVQGRMAGATDYLTKPFDPEQLRETVRQFLPSPANC